MSTILGQLRHYLTECQDREKSFLHNANGADNSKCSSLNGYLPVETKNGIFDWKTDTSGYYCCTSNSSITLGLIYAQIQFEYSAVCLSVIFELLPSLVLLDFDSDLPKNKKKHCILWLYVTVSPPTGFQLCQLYKIPGHCIQHGDTVT